MQSLTFWFDYISPYAFLAWQQLPALIGRHGLSLKPVPVLFGGLLQANGHKGPAEIPAKRSWVYADALRSAAIDGIMLQFPPTHPFNPLPALRATLKTAADAPEKLELVIGDLFAAAWQAGHDLSQFKTVAGVLANHGLPFSEADCNSPEIKAALRNNTDSALAAGVFGVPSYGLEDGTRLWGHDRLAQLDYILSHGDPLDRELLAEALATPWGIEPR
ncbi:MAG: 2-hydroxychromene-2-carboxylate isomerase [Candidatus Melainabacteria bacterium HGW-Melainabacteria-1]|nr:MAG: 2-hydroxychromene-2-carboxylate isomerase [Candidatus Melainabacteria bacterium HGW-Melainabacteria-1]